MQKIIRIFAIIAAVLAGFSLILLLLTFPFQRILAQIMFNYPDYIISDLPIFPLVPFLLCLLKTGCISLLIICCGNKKGGIWLEILVVIALAIVLPLIGNVATSAYNSYISYIGTVKVVANQFVSIISSYCSAPVGLGQALAYITCGMSIVFKTMSKKQNLVQ